MKRDRRSPRDRFLDNYIGKEESRTVGSLAWALVHAGLLPENCGRNNLYEMLRGVGMLNGMNLPTKKALEKGYAVTEVLDLQDYGDTRQYPALHPRPRITRLGMRAVLIALENGSWEGLFAPEKREPVGKEPKKADKDYKPLF